MGAGYSKKEEKEKRIHSLSSTTTKRSENLNKKDKQTKMDENQSKKGRIISSMSEPQNQILQNQQEKSLFKIKTKKGISSGFLCHIPNPVLITSKNVLSEEDIKPGKKIIISFNNE